MKDDLPFFFSLEIKLNHPNDELDFEKIVALIFAPSNFIVVNLHQLIYFLHHTP
jgi:hypothetical protein